MSFLVLIYLPRAFLAVSCVLAGYCLFRFYANTAGNQQVLPYLLAAGALLSMADESWRGVFAKAAAAERGEDDEDSAMSSTARFFAAVFLLVAGLMCAMTGGFNSFRAACLMILLMLARASLFRNVEIVSPLLAGFTTGMLFVIGMTAHPAFIETLLIRETRLPPLFFAVYVTVLAVMSQIRDASRPRPAPVSDDLANETAARLLTMRDDAIDRSVVWFGGAALLFIPLAAAWIMPWRWLSWAFFLLLVLSLAAKIIPVLVYRSRKDLAAFISSAHRGGAFLNAGIVASLGHYRLHELHPGWSIPLPTNEEMVAIALIALLAAPAWLLRRVAPME